MTMFQNLILIIPEKPDPERDSIAQVWKNNGGQVIRLGRFWDPPKLENKNVRLYGNNSFCLILAQKLQLNLISPPDDFLIHLENR